MSESSYEAIMTKYAEMNAAHPFMEENGYPTSLPLWSVRYKIVDKGLKLKLQAFVII
ncbi:MAG: hypothetical protein K2J82_10905 [Muribaculaceae bacterium]|nr:hypothetical protein [Muribaculaceae bacterium]